MRKLTKVIAAVALVAAIACSAASSASLDRHAYGNHPEIIAVSNFTGTTGGPDFRVHFDYRDAGCKVVGGTWTDQFGLAHDFGVGGPDDSCQAGVGTLAPGSGVCTDPATGNPGAPGSYPQSLVLRDAKGNESPPFPFFIVCVAP